MQVAAGIVGGPPLPPGTRQFQYTVNAQGRLIDPEQFGDIIVKTGDDGRITRVKDVAPRRAGRRRLQHRHALQRPARRRHRRLPAARLQRHRHRQRDLREDGGAQEAASRPGVDYAIPYDTTLFVRESIKDVVKTLFEGDRRWSCWSCSSSCRAGGRRSSRCWRFPSR